MSRATQGVKTASRVFSDSFDSPARAAHTCPMRPARYRTVDLHTHSWISDGSDAPADIIAQAARLHLAAVALTDHDSAAGLNEAATAAAQYGIEYIRGCEITARAEYNPVHILGLWLPEETGPLTDLLRSQHARRAERNSRILARLAEHGIAISEEELHNAGKGDGRGRPHMAQILVARGIVPSIAEAFARYLGDNAPCYVPMQVPSPREIVMRLKEAGATTVIAHPMLLRCPPGWLEDFLADLARDGLDAIEAYHADHSPQQTRYCVDLAQRLSLDLSGGSDYHGSIKPGLKLATGWGGLRVPYFVLEKLKERRKRLGQML